jgi:hypothetical protein
MPSAPPHRSCRGCLPQPLPEQLSGRWSRRWSPRSGAGVGAVLVGVDGDDHHQVQVGDDLDELAAGPSSDKAGVGVHAGGPPLVAVAVPGVEEGRLMSPTPAGARSPQRARGLLCLRVLTGWRLRRSLPSRLMRRPLGASPRTPSPSTSMAARDEAALCCQMGNPRRCGTVYPSDVGTAVKVRAPA